MGAQISQEKLLSILKEIQKLGDSNHTLTSKDLVKEIERLLLHIEEINYS
ncbi:hypothetical protein [Anaerobacillus alkaliphilus]|nr:hypothetical protein [Anaerobacillus alkaliphilus]